MEDIPLDEAQVTENKVRHSRSPKHKLRNKKGTEDSQKLLDIQENKAPSLKQSKVIESDHFFTRVGEWLKNSIVGNISYSMKQNDQNTLLKEEWNVDTASTRIQKKVHNAETSVIHEHSGKIRSKHNRHHTKNSNIVTEDIKDETNRKIKSSKLIKDYENTNNPQDQQKLSEGKKNLVERPRSPTLQNIMLEDNRGHHGISEIQTASSGISQRIFKNTEEQNEGKQKRTSVSPKNAPKVKFFSSDTDILESSFDIATFPTLGGLGRLKQEVEIQYDVEPWEICIGQKTEPIKEGVPIINISDIQDPATFLYRLGINVDKVESMFIKDTNLNGRIRAALIERLENLKEDKMGQFARTSVSIYSHKSDSSRRDSVASTYLPYKFDSKAIDSPKTKKRRRASTFDSSNQSDPKTEDSSKSKNKTKSSIERGQKEEDMDSKTALEPLKTEHKHKRKDSLKLAAEKMDGTDKKRHDKSRKTEQHATEMMRNTKDIILKEIGPFSITRTVVLQIRKGVKWVGSDIEVILEDSCSLQYLEASSVEGWSQSVGQMLLQVPPAHGAPNQPKSERHVALSGACVCFGGFVSIDKTPTTRDIYSRKAPGILLSGSCGAFCETFFRFNSKVLEDETEHSSLHVEIEPLYARKRSVTLRSHAISFSKSSNIFFMDRCSGEPGIAADADLLLGPASEDERESTSKSKLVPPTEGELRILVCSSLQASTQDGDHARKLQGMCLSTVTTYPPPVTSSPTRGQVEQGVDACCAADKSLLECEGGRDQHSLRAEDNRNGTKVGLLYATHLFVEVTCYCIQNY
ncbi:hypothetical protein C0J52_09493 [Blattella germanica]|nr:hypothetical protein C0J52_09493 [Blattella germanica]